MKIKYKKTIEAETSDLNVEEVAELIVKDFKENNCEEEYELIYNDIEDNILDFLLKLGFITEEEKKDMCNCGYYCEANFVNKINNYIKDKYGF